MTGSPGDDLPALLRPLERAGWQVSASQSGATLRRTCMVIDVEYSPGDGELRLLPFTGTGDVDQPVLSMLDAPVTIALTGDTDRDAATVAATAGQLGLLDATRLRRSETDDRRTAVMTRAYRRWIVDPARAYLQTGGRDPARHPDAGYLEDPQIFYAGFFRSTLCYPIPDVLPDLVPDAVPIGLAAWCWREVSAVEHWHLPSEVDMARVNIAATKAVRPYVDTDNGVDWDGVVQALTDARWRLPSGALVAELFGEGWAEITAAVTERIHMWRRLDEDLLGPEAMLRVLTIAGSSPYTGNWWGQGMWPAICQRTVTDAVAAGVALPPPYHLRDPEQLIADLADPDDVTDPVLDWFIGRPAVMVGLRPRAG